MRCVCRDVGRPSNMCHFEQCASTFVSDIHVDVHRMCACMFVYLMNVYINVAAFVHNNALRFLLRLV